MTLDRAEELIQVQLDFKSGYNRNAVRMILNEVSNLHGQAAVDSLIRKFGLAQKFDLAEGADYSKVGR